MPETCQISLISQHKKKNLYNVLLATKWKGEHFFFSSISATLSHMELQESQYSQMNRAIQTGIPSVLCVHASDSFFNKEFKNRIKANICASF